MKLDILAIAAHPDDVELGCAGTLLVHLRAGRKVGVIDLTRGELGTRGSAAQRDQEAADASRVLSLAARENMGFADGFFENNREQQLKLIAAIRRYQPEIVLTNAVEDRHSDHGRASKLVSDSCFLAGLVKIETTDGGERQAAWRPKAVYHFIQDRLLVPDLVVDVTDVWAQKIDSIRAYKTQFFDPGSQEPETHISKPDFLNFIEARALELGHSIGVKYGEGFTKERNLGVRNLFDLL
jgi:bacillithiol biosynthesis deacetylase BshB1